MKLELNKSQINFYKKNGYIVIKNVITKTELRVIKNKLKLLEKKQKKSNFRGLSEPGVSKSLIHSLHKKKFFNEKIFEKNWYKRICQSLIGSKKIITWNCKSNLKRKWHGSAEYYHQDFNYWKVYGFKNYNMLSCMIFVDNHNHQNGGMWLFPKSHLKSVRHEKFLNINSLQKFLIPSKILSRLSKKNKPIHLNEKAGSCIFFHCKLIHGSGHNISGNDRIILLSQVADYNDFLRVDKNKVDSNSSAIRKIYEKKILKKRLSTINK